MAQKNSIIMTFYRFCCLVMTSSSEPLQHKDQTMKYQEWSFCALE